jgi:hypothetical protein
MPGPSALPANCIRPGWGSCRGGLLTWLMAFVLTVGLSVLATQHAFAQTVLTTGTGSITLGNLTFTYSGCPYMQATWNCSGVEWQATASRSGITLTFTGDANSDSISAVTGSSQEDVMFNLSVTAANGAGVSSIVTALVASSYSTGNLYTTLCAGSNTANNCGSGGGSQTNATPSSIYINANPTSTGTRTSSLSSPASSLSLSYLIESKSGASGQQITDATLLFSGTGIAEPSSARMMAVGLFGLVVLRWRCGRAGWGACQGRRCDGLGRRRGAYTDWRSGRQGRRAFA